MRSNIRQGGRTVVNGAANPLMSTREALRAKRITDITSASVKVFSQEGSSGFSMRKVATTAGVRLSTLQSHFGDLESLLRATISAKMEEYEHRYRELASEHRLPAQPRLEAVLADVTTEIANPAVSSFFIEAWALGNHDREISQLLGRTYTEFRVSLTALVKESQPDLSDSEAAVVGAVITAWTEGFMVLSHFTKPELPELSAMSASIKAAALSAF